VFKPMKKRALASALRKMSQAHMSQTQKNRFKMACRRYESVVVSLEYGQLRLVDFPPPQKTKRKDGASAR
jgi:hypothetical protein